MDTMRGKSVIVTGAGGAIGRQLVGVLATRGARVLAADLPGHTGVVHAVRSAQELGGDVSAAGVDIRSVPSVQAMVDQAVATWGGIDVLVNNAGVFHAIGACWEQDPEVWLSDVTTNLFGTFACSRAVIPHMLAAGRGTIINLAGGGFDAPNPGGASYAASKAGVVRFTDTLAAELDGAGATIAVHALMPGLVRSHMTQTLADTSTGQKWLPHVAAGLRAGEDVSARTVAEALIRLVQRAHDIPSGRVFGYDDDLDAVAASAARIDAADLFQLRWRRDDAYLDPALAGLKRAGDR